MSEDITEEEIKKKFTVHPWSDLKKELKDQNILVTTRDVPISELAELMIKDEVKAIEALVQTGDLIFVSSKVQEAWDESNPSLNILYLEPYVLLEQAKKSDETELEEKEEEVKENEDKT